MADLQIIKKLVDTGRLDEAVELLSKALITDPENASLYFDRGKVYWRLGRRSEAMGDYARAAAIDPGSPAVHALEQAHEIVSFFNPDLYNP